MRKLPRATRLTPGRYVGSEDADKDEEPIEEKLARLRGQLLEELDEAGRLSESGYRRQTVTGGRAATTGTISGDLSLAVGCPHRTTEGHGWRLGVRTAETGHTQVDA